jgi:hypothetical protein
MRSSEPIKRMRKVFETISRPQLKSAEYEKPLNSSCIA